MSAAPQPRPAKLSILTDDDLRRLVDRRQGTALHVMLYVRKRAMVKGRYAIEVANEELERALGVDRRQLQRAKAYLRLRGFLIDQGERGKQGPNGNRSVATQYSIDRRLVRALRPLELVTEEPPRGGAEDHDHRFLETLSSSETTFGGLKDEERARAGAREGPPASIEAGGEVEEEQRLTGPESPPGLDVGVPLEDDRPPPAVLEPELSLLRQWWIERVGNLGDEGAVRRRALLRIGERWLVDGGASPFRAVLARSQLERELDDGDASRAPRSSDGGLTNRVVESSGAPAAVDEGEREGAS